MRSIISDFFQPILMKDRELVKQLAVEIYINALEEQLTTMADKHRQKFDEKEITRQRGPLHALEQLVLRYPNPLKWQGYLDHEIKRKSGSLQKLLKTIRDSLPDKTGRFGKGHPVACALNEARNIAQDVYRRHYRRFPLTDEEIVELEAQLAGPALREFLSCLLGRWL
jgi:hypothetical protein